MSAADAASEGLVEGDVLEISSPRSAIRARLRVSGIRDGVLFIPFHYGYWDDPEHPPRAANELTMTDWDALSKQPTFKTAAARVRLVARDARGSPAPTTAASAPAAGRAGATIGGTDAEAEERAA
jgi:anaerobic selenocysteine-containing dehydrogenase